MAKESLRVVIINDDPGDVGLLRQELCSATRDRLIAFRGEDRRGGNSGMSGSGISTPRLRDCRPSPSRHERPRRLEATPGRCGRNPIPGCPVYRLRGGMQGGHAALRAGAEDYIAKSWLTPDGLSCRSGTRSSGSSSARNCGPNATGLDRKDSEFKSLVENIPRHHRPIRHTIASYLYQPCD